MSNNRSWMYERLANGGFLNEDFKKGVNEFIQAAVNLYPSGVIACPCRKCKNRKLLTWDIVRQHLFEKGFVEDYYVWGAHGETHNSNGLVYLLHLKNTYNKLNNLKLKLEAPRMHPKLHFLICIPNIWKLLDARTKKYLD
ncbi:unnamed protein product [Cuscuta europaea]|uniref:Transposase-associated domain-containing protein n=1 Tax=Cuscuta europaea TaxID=41803 RepID=A0A9P0ZN16_CUSEU|nr:unnamed protein product [Cuscuta europaea]